MGSFDTTWLGPRVSLRSLPSAPQVPHLYLDSNTTLEIAGGRLKVGATNAAPLTSMVRSTFTFDPGSQAVGVTSLRSVAVSGVNAGDLVFINAGSSLSINFNLRAYCESSGSVVYELGNVGGATQDLSVITAQLVALRLA